MCLLTLPVLLVLGFWQLDRAEEKRQRQAALEQAQAQAPVALSADNAQDLAVYRRVLVEGRYLSERNWLLDNQQRNGQVGYDVITPFELEDGTTLLVNRGWVAGGDSRAERPDPPAPATNVTLFAQWLSPSEHPLLDGESDDAGWPKVILAIDPKPMAVHLGRPLLNQYARLDEGSPGALLIDWPELEVSAAKHLGYAFQWFAMAFAVVVWFLFANSNLWSWWRSRSR